jgi:hypothetical protein
VLGVPAVLEADNVDDVDGDGLIGCGNSEQLPPVRAPQRLARRHLVPFGHLVVNLVFEVREGGAQHPLEGEEHPVGAGGHAGGSGAVDEVGRHEGAESGSRCPAR